MFVNLGLNTLRDGEERVFILDRNLRGLFRFHRRKKHVAGENYATRNFMIYASGMEWSLLHKVNLRRWTTEMYSITKIIAAIFVYN